MSSVPASDRHAVAPAVEDWYGLAAYLAESIDAGDLDIETAQEALGAAEGPDDLDALRAAADVAAARLGDDAVPTRMLRAALAGSVISRVA